MSEFTLEDAARTQDVLGDATSHRDAWMGVFDDAKSHMRKVNPDDDGSYLEHERSALLRLLNAVDALGWMTSVTHNDGSKEVFFRPHGGSVVSGQGADWGDAIYASQDVLKEEIETTHS